MPQTERQTHDRLLPPFFVGAKNKTLVAVTFRRVVFSIVRTYRHERKSPIKLDDGGSWRGARAAATAEFHQDRETRLPFPADCGFLLKGTFQSA